LQILFKEVYLFFDKVEGVSKMSNIV